MKDQLFKKGSVVKVRDGAYTNSPTLKNMSLLTGKVILLQKMKENGKLSVWVEFELEKVSPTDLPMVDIDASAPFIEFSRGTLMPRGKILAVYEKEDLILIRE